MSKFAAEKLGPVPACIGKNSELFAECILHVHNNEEDWSSFRREGVVFARRNRGRHKTLAEWERLIEGIGGFSQEILSFFVSLPVSKYIKYL